MNFLPIFYQISGKPCLVIGGGAIAARKAELLLKAGGKLLVIAPEIDDRIRDMATDQTLEFEQRGFAVDDLKGMVCVIAATDDMALNREISAQAQAQCIPVNVVDSPDLCSFVFPSIVDRSPLVIAVGAPGARELIGPHIQSRGHVVGEDAWFVA